MSRSSIVGGHKTTVSRKADGSLPVTYHSTEVVKVALDGTVTLDTGGWRSNTTKLRMNQAAQQYGLGFGVFQKNFDWFVCFVNPAYDGSQSNYWLPDKNNLPFDGRTIVFNPSKQLQTA